MDKRLRNALLATAGIIATIPAAGAATPAAGPVSLTEQPLVMRLSKDEFRIAFGIDAGRCAASGCNGVIRYRVEWRTEDGTVRSEIRHVSYSVLPNSSRAMTVDRQYFDTAEGAHRTDVLKVSILSP